MRLKESTVFDRPHLKRSAWVGVDSMPRVFYQNIKSFSQRDLPTSRRAKKPWIGWFKTKQQTCQYRSRRQTSNAGNGHP